MGASFSSEDPSEQDRNLRFYRNEIRSSPWPGSKIADMLLWTGKYNKLESNHNYIQWLFPTPEGSGMNPYAQPLREHEAKAIREDDMASARVLMSYRMMLDFYGMRLVNPIVGKVIRSENWQERYKHLNRSTHNYRRITRIIKSLGELGYERFQCQWITFLLEESIINQVLPNLNGPCMKHFIAAIKDDVEKEQMFKNYFELIRKPTPGLCARPRQNADTNNTAISAEKRAHDKHELHNGRVQNGGGDFINQTFDFQNDSNIPRQTNVTTSDNEGAVDFGPAADDNDKTKDIPYIDCTCNGSGQKTECVTHTGNGKDDFSADGGTDVDYGSAINVKL